MKTFSLPALIVVSAFYAISPQISHANECLADEAVLNDIRRQQNEIKEERKKLEEREAELQALEKAVQEKMDQIEQMKKDLVVLEAVQSGGAEEKVNKLVETFESMSPKKAAGILAKVDNALAVAAIQKISTQKLAKIMNVMDVKRSTELSELLTIANAKRRTEKAPQ